MVRFVSYTTDQTMWLVYSYSLDKPVTMVAICESESDANSYAEKLRLKAGINSDIFYVVSGHNITRCWEANEEFKPGTDVVRWKLDED